MEKFEVVVEPPALEDIQSAIDYYEEIEIGLGRTFENELDNFISTLKTFPFFQRRYSDVHCLPLKISSHDSLYN
ncbi:hypothetical protein [Gracilimonas sp.]|uniref:hypothetical protein n=1 Tax=Gracilimonas sp. TaxID=1974203 RepID=UPI0025BBBB06|nr:hypothetical protein [Gracilimonas sp.]